MSRHSDSLANWQALSEQLPESCLRIASTSLRKSSTVLPEARKLQTSNRAAAIRTVNEPDDNMKPPLRRTLVLFKYGESNQKINTKFIAHKGRPKNIGKKNPLAEGTE